ncbi:MAG: hypothetical protein FWD26_01525 [Treponema sp.]|nr:hypothetical protein [Treponema sp.]
MTSNSSTQSNENNEKSFALAKDLFPSEEWVSTEPNIFVAKSRLSQKQREPRKWEKEMAQVRILTSRGSIAYFLPEILIQNGNWDLCADLVLDGEVVEMKTITGARATLGSKFSHGYKQGALLLKNCQLSKKHSVFIRLLSDLSIGSVKSKIAGELKYRLDEGSFICFFETTGKLYTWTYEELRAIIGTNTDI